MLDWFLRMLDVVGYPIVFGTAVLKNIFAFGPLTPGEGVIVAGAFLSNPQYGTLSWPAVWFAAVSGTVLGSNISYYLGRKHGRDALLRYGERLRISEERVARVEEYFQTHGAKTLVIGRFAFGLKNYVPVIAGTSRMELPRFQFYTVIGAAVYTTFIMLIGYLIGENLEAAIALILQVGYVGAAAVLVFFAGMIVTRRRARMLCEATRR